MTKWKTVAIRVSEEQEQDIIERAFQSKMSKNEYIKARLFEDNDNKEKQITEYEKILISSSVKSFWMSQNIPILVKDAIEKKDTTKRVNKFLKLADKFLVEKGFKTQEEFDKLYNNK